MYNFFGVTNRNHDLTRHQKVHSQDKPHMCQHCGRSFSRRDALRRHERMDPEGKRIHCSLNPVDGLPHSAIERNINTPSYYAENNSSNTRQPSSSPEIKEDSINDEEEARHIMSDDGDDLDIDQVRMDYRQHHSNGDGMSTKSLLH